MSNSVATERAKRCHGCKYSRWITTGGQWSFYGCSHYPYQGKWIVEIDKCPRDPYDNFD